MVKKQKQSNKKTRESVTKVIKNEFKNRDSI